MEKIEFVKMGVEHGKEIMDIFNVYVEKGSAAYPPRALPYEFFGKFMEITSGYPAFTITSGKEVAGFCFLKPHNPMPTFRRTAEITYFIKEEFTGKGIGSMALTTLEHEASQIGIKNILASISSENPGSINFHKQHGFHECGRFEKVGEKFGNIFDIVWMEKLL